MDKIKPLKVDTFTKSRYVRVYTNIILTSILFITVILLILSSGNFLSGWFAVTSCIVITLIFISAPKHFVTYKDKIVVQCMVESVVVKIENIEQVRELSDVKITNYIPLYTSFGFLGYFGFYIDYKNGWQLVHMLCTNFDNCIEITTKNKKKYLVSVSMPQELKEMLEEGSNTPENIV